MFSGLYSTTSGFVDAAPFLDTWVAGPSDPLQNKAGALIDFCFPNSSALGPGSYEAHSYETLKGLLTAENIKHFLREYRNYHSHWPMIHMPSFNPLHANNGLVLTMICIGAVYSDKLGVKEVRWLMELIRACVYRSSQVYQLVSQDTQDVVDPRGRPTSDVEEIQALVLLQSLFIWHGSQEQRQRGRDDFWVLAEVARMVDLFNPTPSGCINYSALHHPGPLNGNEINSWTWTAWVQQEKRIRILYLIFLLDAALAIFFNVEPHLDVNEIKLPLPADDAAWDARSREDCAGALGLRGASAQGRNITGSKSAKQIGMVEALNLLYHNGDFPQRATNVYSKFILIHAIHMEIFNIQRHIVTVSGLPGYNGRSSSGTSTPHSQSDRALTDGSTSNATSGHVTPVEGINNQYSQAHHRLRLTMSALDAWKNIWDADMVVQYHPDQRRLGFCRDGIHYYFLARIFLRSSRREAWAAPADNRCQQVFDLLKQIRAHVATDSVQRGLEVGSVTAVNDNYGIADLTLDMKLLFTPITNSAR
jgi:hypothetical protein